MKLNFRKTKKFNSIPIEVDFIRACARMEVTDAWASWIDVLLKAKLDWDKVQIFAKHHCVIPLVYRTLCTHFQDQIPEQVIHELRLAYQTNAARNLFHINELLKLMEVFQTKGIDVIAIKGPILAKCLYGDVTYRQFSDLDLLIHERDVAAVNDMLQSIGYSPNIVGIGLEAQTVLKNEGECGYSSPCNRVHLDVHWRMIPRNFMKLDHEGMWARSRISSVDGSSVRVFSPEDQLILLSIHGMRHLWARHAWILDLAQTVRTNPDLDWDEVFDRDRPIQLERFVNVGLLLAWEYEDLELPEWVSNQIQSDYEAVDLVNDLRFSSDFHLPQQPSLIKMILMNTRSREGWKNRVQYFMGQMLSPSKKDWALIRIPKPMIFLYGVVRPLRIFKEYGLKPLTRRLAAFLGID